MDEKLSQKAPKKNTAITFTKNGFESLICNIKHRILSFCDISELHELSKVSKLLNHTVQGSEMWGEIIIQRILTNENSSQVCRIEEEELDRLQLEASKSNFRKWRSFLLNLGEVSKKSVIFVGNCKINQKQNLVKGLLSKLTQPELISPTLHKSVPGENASTEFQQFQCDVIFKAYDESEFYLINSKNFKEKTLGNALPELDDSQSIENQSMYDDDDDENLPKKSIFEVIDQWVNIKKESLTHMLWNSKKQEFVALRWFYHICQKKGPSYPIFGEENAYSI